MKRTTALPLFLVFAVFFAGFHSPASAASQDQGRLKEVAQLRTQLAAAYYARGQYSVALEEIKNALAAVSDYAPAFNVQGLVYMDLREWDTAEEHFQRALRLDSNDPDSNHNFGWFLCMKRSRQLESLKYFTAAAKNPLYATPEKSLLQAGICALKGGDLEAADDFLQKSDRQQANNPQTLLALAQLAWKRKQVNAARGLLLQQARLTAATAESLWLNVRVERKLGNADNETGFAKELRTRFPDSEEALALADGKFD